MAHPGAETPWAPRSSAEGASRVERRRREDRGAEVAKGGGAWVGCPPPLVGRGLGDRETGGGVWGGGCAPSPETFSIFELKKAGFGASWLLFFAVD